MGKLNKVGTRPRAGAGPIVSGQAPTLTTGEGAPGYARDAKSELFLLAVTNLVGEQTFYEGASARDSRFGALVRTVAVADPAWMLAFVTWLRGDGNMRTASIVAAAEAVKAHLDARMLVVPGGKGDDKGFGRLVVDAALQRADEPGELVAYWLANHGRRLPKPVKRGVADAVRRLYNEYSLLKYDTASHGVRFGDVLDLTHPSPATPVQGALFTYAIDRRHNRDNDVPESLQMVRSNQAWRAMVTENPDLVFNPETLKLAGVTWEDGLSLLGSKVDKRKLWEALIPSMGYMALLRNLRNLDEAGVSDRVAQVVAAKLADPAQVARSRQFPMRFLSAYRAAPSLRWGYALEQALGHSLANIPWLPGRTLILVDVSGSMENLFSKDGTLLRWDAATLFGLALAQRCAFPDVVSFDSTTSVFKVKGGESVLKGLDRWKAEGHFRRGGTNTTHAVRCHFKGHDRVVILTDEQAHDGNPGSALPTSTPLYTWNLAGYQAGHTAARPGRWTFGGLTDAGFRMIPLLERGTDGRWPWQEQAG